jgi:hypothetical protein
LSSQPSNSNAATKRALALALGVILIIIAALFLRRDPAEVVVAQAPPRGSVATPRVEPTPVPTDSQVEHETPAAVPVDSHATEISSAVSSEPEILIHVTAAIEGGCEIPRDAPVAFMQIMPGDQPAFIERRLLSEVGVDAGYTLHWQPGAIALGVHVESEVGAIPGMTFARQSLDGLRPGAYARPTTEDRGNHRFEHRSNARANGRLDDPAWRLPSAARAATRAGGNEEISHAYDGRNLSLHGRLGTPIRRLAFDDRGCRGVH